MTATEIVEPPRRSSWPTGAMLVWVRWGLSELVLWRLSSACALGYRRFLFRLYGPKVGKGVKVVSLWNLAFVENARIAVESIVFCGQRVPNGALVGSGSPVDAQFEPWTMATGHPARSPIGRHIQGVKS